MKMIACGKPRLARLADDLALGDVVADLHVDRAQVAVEREEAEAVVEDDRVAVDAEIAGERDHTAVGRLDRIILRRGEVVAEVIGGIDRLLVVGVCQRHQARGESPLRSCPDEFDSDTRT